MAVDRHEVANGDNDLLYLLRELSRGRKDQGLTCLHIRIQFLENRDGECGCLSSTRLSLRDYIGA